MVDPYGLEARFADSTDAHDIKNSLNEELGENAVNVEKVTKPAVTIKLPLIGKITLSNEKTYWKLVANPDSDFNWNQNSVTAALKDVMESKEVIFNISLAEGRSWEARGGETDPYLAFWKPEGADITFSKTGYKQSAKTGRPQDTYSEPLAVVFLHEILGHGHPVGNSFYRWDDPNPTPLGAIGIQWFFGYYRNDPGHSGASPYIDWKTHSPTPKIVFK
jgi:hypothetical protein